MLRILPAAVFAPSLASVVARSSGNFACAQRQAALSGAGLAGSLSGAQRACRLRVHVWKERYWKALSRVAHSAAASNALSTRLWRAHRAAECTAPPLHLPVESSVWVCTGWYRGGWRVRMCVFGVARPHDRCRTANGGSVGAITPLSATEYTQHQTKKQTDTTETVTA